MQRKPTIMMCLAAVSISAGILCSIDSAFGAAASGESGSAAPSTNASGSAPGVTNSVAADDDVVLPIDSITRADAQSGTNTVRVRGMVLNQRVGESVVIRDHTGAIVAETATSIALKAAEEIEVQGTPAWDGTRLFLKNASITRIDMPPRPEPGVQSPGRPDTLPELTSAQSVRDLTPERAAWQYPVRLRGVVTSYSPARWQFYIQDHSAGIYVRVSTNMPAISAGDLIELEGLSDPGWFAPDVIPLKIQVAGRAPFPEPRRATLFQLATGEFDSQWIEVRGVVRSVIHDSNLLRLRISDSDGTLMVTIPTDLKPANLMDAVVRIRGVCMSRFNNRRQIVGVAILCPSIGELAIEQPGLDDPLQMPAQPIVSLSQFHSRRDAFPRRSKIAGIVTLIQSDSSFFVQDTNDGVRVVTAEKVSVSPGDRVEVSGYPAVSEYGSALHDAIIRVLSKGPLPEPRPVSSERLIDPRLHGMWARVEARISHVEFDASDRMQVLTLQHGDRMFRAQRLGGSSRSVPPAGSLVRVTGLYEILADETRAPKSFRMTFPADARIEVISRPPLLSFRQAMVAVGLMSICVTGALLWGLVLRRKVREQTLSLKQSEQKFRSLVEQSLVGVYIIQEGRFAYVNPRLCHILGFTEEELTNRPVLDAVSEEDRSLVATQIDRRISNEVSTVQYSFRGRRKDGSMVFLEVLGSRTEFRGKPAVLGTALDMTERKRAEEEVFNSRQMLRVVLDTIPQRVFWKDRESRFLGCNQPLANDCGYADPSGLIGKTDFETASADRAAMFQEDDRRVMESGTAKLNYEEIQVRADGSTGWLRTSKVPMRDKEGNVIGVLGTYEDITERKQAEAALAHASGLLDALLDNSPDHIYFKDRESRFVRYSKSFAELLRLPDPESIKGKTDFDLFHEEHARPAFEDEQRIIQTGEPIIGKLEKEAHADGRVTWALTTKLPWRDDQGNIIGTFGISKDVTAIKEAEDRLEYEQELFRTIFDNLPDAIYFKDLQSRFVRLSRSKVERSRELVLARFRAGNPEIGTAHLPLYLTDTDRFAEYLIGKSDFDVYPEERARIAFEDEQQIIRSGKPIIGKPEHVTLLDGKTVWVLTTKMPWKDSQGRIIGTFGVSRDISALKEAEGQLEAAHQRLVETSRLAGMAEVATDVLHNVGNVLNSVNVSCSLTIDRVKNSRVSSLGKVSELIHENRHRLGDFLAIDPRGQQIPAYLGALAEHLSTEQSALIKELSQLLKHVDHIKQIVAMQQSYAKVAGVLEAVDPVQLVEDALHINAAALARHDVQVDRDFHQAPVVQTEKHKVLQILVNLIRNAKYAMDESKRHDKRLKVNVAHDGNGAVVIQVIDNGVGIPKENLTRIFGHGFTTRRNGHGFGLHSSALAVRELGGSLLAHSDGPGTGATFTLKLPLKRPSEPHATP